LRIEFFFFSGHQFAITGANGTYNAHFFTCRSVLHNWIFFIKVKPRG